MVALTTLVYKLCVVSGLILMFWIYPCCAKHTGEPFNLVTDAQGKNYADSDTSAKFFVH